MPLISTNFLFFFLHFLHLFFLDLIVPLSHTPLVSAFRERKVCSPNGVSSCPIVETRGGEYESDVVSLSLTFETWPLHLCRRPRVSHQSRIFLSLFFLSLFALPHPSMLPMTRRSRPWKGAAQKRKGRTEGGRCRADGQLRLWLGRQRPRMVPAPATRARPHLRVVAPRPRQMDREEHPREGHHVRRRPT